MTDLRQLLTRRPALAGLVVALALLLRLVVPAGYMIGETNGTPGLELCGGVVTAPAAHAMAHHGSGHDHRGGSEHGKTEMPCAFGGLAAPALAGADTFLLAGLIAFLFLAPLVTPAPSALRPAPPHLRPPLRGPPACA